MFLANLRGVSMFSFTLSLDLSERGVTVCSFTGLDLAERGIIMCDFHLDVTLKRGVSECYFSSFWSWRILVFMSFLSLDGYSWKTLVLTSFTSLNYQSLRALVFEYIP